MSLYEVKITGHANYPISSKNQVNADDFMQAMIKGFHKFWVEEGQDKLKKKRRKKIKSINLSIQKV